MWRYFGSEMVRFLAPCSFLLTEACRGIDAVVLNAYLRWEQLTKVALARRSSGSPGVTNVFNYLFLTSSHYHVSNSSPMPWLALRSRLVKATRDQSISCNRDILMCSLCHFGVVVMSLDLDVQRPGLLLQVQEMVETS